MKTLILIVVGIPVLVLILSLSSCIKPGCLPKSTPKERVLDPEVDSLEIWEDEQFASYCEKSKAPTCFKPPSCPSFDY